MIDALHWLGKQPRLTRRGLAEVVWLLWSEMDTFAVRRLWLTLFFVLGSAVLTGLAPVALKLVIDGFTVRAEGEIFIAPLLLILAYVVSQWLARSFAELQMLTHGRAEQRVHRRLSRRLFEHIMALPMRFHLERKTGALSQTLANGLMGYRLILTHLIHSVLPVVIQLATMAGVLIHFGYPMFLAILTVSLAAYAIAFAIGIIRITGPSRTVSTANIDANAVMTDSILNYETVKYFDAETHVQGRYDEALTRSEREWGRFYARKTANGLVVATIFGLSLATCIGFAAREVLAGRMTVGDFVLVNTYLLTIVRPLEMIGFALRDIAQGLAFIEKMLDLFREKPEPRLVAGAKASPSGAAALVFENVDFAYRPDRKILKGVSFTVEPGKTVAIVGPSGSGKSSLIRLLVRLYEPDGGRILLGGVPISEMSTSSLRRAIAVVPQDTVLFHDTIAYNIEFGNQGSDQGEIERAAKLAHIHDFITSLPDGYRTMVGERGLKLSGGEKQRVAIARAALKHPRVYVFDEATSSLDSRTEREILSNLIEVSRGTTTLIIAHRLSTVVHADEIVVLSRGQIVERGLHAQLLERTGTYAAMWQAQHRSDSKDATTAA